MEGTPNRGGEHDYLALVPPPEESHDERVIREGIERALRDGTEIDDSTARYIASQLHEGQASALYSLASTGNIAEEVHDELTRDFEQQTDQVKWWVNWLGTYCLNREDKGPIEGWAASAAAIDQEEEEASARQVLFDRISAAGVTTLGQIATVIDGSTVEQTTDDDEDVFSWTDAATWSPDSRRDELTRDRLDELFGEIPDEEIGSTQDIGWFGLLKHEGRPGGLVLSQNEYGLRRVREFRSDEELQAHWDQLQQEYDAFTEATRAHAREPGDRNDDQERQETTSSHNPEIWVGSLSDYNNGRLHGVWLDATLDPDELHAAVAFMLRNSYEADAEEWAIMDYDDFCGMNLGEYESFAVVSRIAKGIAEHGEAFARWVDYVGERSEEALDRFEDHYLGAFESTEAYVENMLVEGDAYSFEEFVPEWLRAYVKIDVELLARDSEIELYVAEAANGGLFVFDPRC